MKIAIMPVKISGHYRGENYAGVKNRPGMRKNHGMRVIGKIYC